MKNQQNEDSVEQFNGTIKRGNMFRILYEKWVSLPPRWKKDISLLTLLTNLNARTVVEDILPQLRKAEQLENMGVDPFNLYNEDLRSKLADPGEAVDAEFTPLTKTIHLGAHKKTVPLSREEINCVLEEQRKKAVVKNDE